MKQKRQLTETFCNQCRGTGIDWTKSTILNPRPPCSYCGGSGKIRAYNPKTQPKDQERIPYDDGSKEGPIINVKITTLSDGQSRTEDFTIRNAFDLQYLSMLEAEFINTIARNVQPPDERKYIVSDCLDALNGITIEVTF